MWFTKVRAWVNTHRILALVIAALFLVALASAYDSCRHRSKLADAKAAEKAKAAEAEALKRENEVQTDAYQKAMGATDPRLGEVLREIKTVKTGLARVEAARRELWAVPAVDNGELVTRFDRAVEGLR